MSDKKIHKQIKQIHLLNIVQKKNIYMMNKCEDIVKIDIKQQTSYLTGNSLKTNIQDNNNIHMLSQ